MSRGEDVPMVERKNEQEKAEDKGTGCCGVDCCGGRSGAKTHQAPVGGIGTTGMGRA